MNLYALSIVLASFLLFQIQPLIGKYILPWFGSSPAVWSASLLFFQAMLSAGYAYAYALVGRFPLRRQAQIHLGLLALSLVYLAVNSAVWPAPVTPGAAWQPKPESAPIVETVKVLFAAVGLPYFLLASNSTLLQAWFSRQHPQRSPYRLYALSNIASLAGLLSYPFLVEPRLSITAQAWLWTAVYAGFVFSGGLLALRLSRAPQEAMAQSPEVEAPVVTPPARLTPLLWLLLPAAASILLISITNQLTQEVAVIPFLWVLPLALYLLSFILSFDSDRWYGRVRFTLVLALAALAFGLLLSKGPLVDYRIQAAGYCLLLFTLCMILHGELAGMRPHPSHLTRYYLLIALGGALGGIFVNLVAPLMLDFYWELTFGVAAGLVLFMLTTLFLRGQRSGWLSAFLVLVQFGVLIYSANLLVQDLQGVMRGSLYTTRNFFGILRVKETRVGDAQEPAYQLVHGITIHGLQFQSPELRRQPTMYYTASSGAGLAFQYFLEQDAPLHAAVLGLGTGTQAVYGRSGDRIRFYEINPDVVEIARGAGGFFTYLADSPAEIEIVLGDARLSLEQELADQGSQQFDLIILDTFSSDSIPVHLVTREALALYQQHLKPDGIIAVHISNIHLDLRPVVWGLADAAQLDVVLIAAGRSMPGSSPSVWMLLTENQAFLNMPEVQQAAESRPPDLPKIPLWTDNYSNLFQILR